MRKMTLGLVLIWTASITQQTFGQDFWYVPPGLDFGYRAGIDLGNGAGFGYGIGVGFTKNQGSATAPVFQPNQFLTSSTGNSVGQTPTPEITSNADKQTLLAESVAKKQNLELRRQKAKEEARLRNARYFQYLQSHR